MRKKAKKMFMKNSIILNHFTMINYIISKFPPNVLSTFNLFYLFIYKIYRYIFNVTFCILTFAYYVCYASNLPFS